jgi:RecA/RadA recombinase
MPLVDQYVQDFNEWDQNSLTYFDHMGSDASYIYSFNCPPIDIPYGGGIYCLTGDTKISLLNGTEVPIQDLIGIDEFWVYSCEEDGTIVPGRGHSARITGEVVELIEVTLDNNTKIKCTPDHKFMLRNGTYIEAKNLKSNMSLMPLYFVVGPSRWKDYSCFIDNKTGKKKFTHRMVVNELLGGYKNNQVVHHIDFNSRNNDLHNLVLMDKNEHTELHSEISSNMLKKLWQNPEYKKKMVAISSDRMKKMWENPEFRKLSSKNSSKRNKENWQNLKYREKMSSMISNLMKKFMKEDWFKIKFSNALKETWKNSEYRKKMKKHQSLNMKKLNQVQWQDFEFKKRMSQVSSDCMSRNWENPEFRSKMSKISSKRITDRNNMVVNETCSVCGKFLKKYAHVISHKKQCKNHRIIETKIIKLDKPVKVYDITVDKYHNFLVENGVFIHNSGKVYEIFGPEGVGKSSTAQEIAKCFHEHWQSLNDDKYLILWIETEVAMDKVRAYHMGVPVHKILTREAETVEEAKQIMVSYLERCIMKGLKLLIIWDTLAAAITEAEKAQTMQLASDKVKENKKKSLLLSGAGLQEKPRLIRDLLSSLVPLLGKTDSTLILVNQVYSTFEMFGDKMKSPGGRSILFYAAVRTKVGIAEREMNDDGGGLDKMRIRYTHIKNKLTIPRQESIVVFDPEKGIDKLATCIEYLKDKTPHYTPGSYKVLEYPSSNNSFMEYKFQNLDQLRELINKEPKILEWIHYLCYSTYMRYSTLTRIKIIEKLWDYEIKFFGEKRTILPEDELSILNFKNSETKKKKSNESKGKSKKA